MSFLLNRRLADFARELNFDQLLAVNGGCGGSFSGDSGYTGGSGENHGYNSYGSGGSGSSSSGSGSCNGSGGYSGGSSSSGSGSCSGSGSYSGGSSSSGSGSCSGTGSYNSGSSSTSSSGSCGGGANLSSAISSSVDTHLKESYVSGVNDCDIWVQNILDDAGYDISSIWGDASTTNCDGHEIALEGKTTNTASTGWSVVIMSDSTTGAEAHTGLIKVSSSGSVTFADESSGNQNSNSARHYFSSVSAFESHYTQNSSYTDYDYYHVSN